VELTPRQIAALLAASAAGIGAEVEALPPSLAAWHPAPGEWCVKECLGHLIEAERRGFAGRIRFLVTSDGAPALASWDQVEVARARNDCDADLAQLLDEFAADRAASVTLVASLSESQLGRGGEHPQVGHLTVAEVVSEWVHHDRNHFKQMLGNVQECAWRQMGNARAFSLPH
jgi:hypothetical protein